MGEYWVGTWTCKKDKPECIRRIRESQLEDTGIVSSIQQNIFSEREKQEQCSENWFLQDGSISPRDSASLSDSGSHLWKHPAFPQELLQDLNSSQDFTEVKDIPACSGLQRFSGIRGGGFARDQGPVCIRQKMQPPLLLKLEQKVPLINKTKLQILASFHKFQRSLKHLSSKLPKL